MTKDIMRAAIAKDITEAKEDNIKFINKMDQMIAVLQDTSTTPQLVKKWTIFLGKW